MESILISAQNGVTVTASVGQRIRYMNKGMFYGKFGEIVDITAEGKAVVKFDGVNHQQTLNPAYMVAS